MCLFSIRSSKIQWMSTWSTILAHPCTIAFINAHTFQQILRCCAALVRLPPVCVIWYITSEKTSQYYLRLVSAHKHSKVICHRQSVWHSHLTDTWHIIRVIFCHGHFSAVAAADKDSCSTATECSLSLTYWLPMWVDFTLLHFAQQHNCRHWKQQHDTLFLMIFFGDASKSVAANVAAVALQWPLVISWWSSPSV